MINQSCKTVSGYFLCPCRNLRGRAYCKTCQNCNDTGIRSDIIKPKQNISSYNEYVWFMLYLLIIIVTIVGLIYYSSSY